MHEWVGVCLHLGQLGKNSFKNSAALKTIKSRTWVSVHHDTGAGQTLVGMSICPGQESDRGSGY